MEHEKASIHVVPSGEALSLAAKLLGVKSFDEVIASERQQEVREEFRPPLLGLGADPKKQAKALSAAMKVERKLAQRIKGKANAEGLEASGKHKSQRMAQKETSGSEAEDEEQGRAGAILQGPKQEAQGWSKTEASRTNKRKRKKQRLQSQQ